MFRKTNGVPWRQSENALTSRHCSASENTRTPRNHDPDRRRRHVSPRSLAELRDVHRRLARERHDRASHVLDRALAEQVGAAAEIAGEALEPERAAPRLDERLHIQFEAGDVRRRRPTRGDVVVRRDPKVLLDPKG